MPDSQERTEKFNREAEFSRRINKLEESQQKLNDSLTKLSSSVDRMAHGIDTMRETLTRMLNKEEKNHEYQLKVVNLENKMQLVMFVGAGIVMSLIGLGVTTLFGSP